MATHIGSCFGEDAPVGLGGATDLVDVGTSGRYSPSRKRLVVILGSNYYRTFHGVEPQDAEKLERVAHEGKRRR
jgi:hypothetical protein